MLQTIIYTCYVIDMFPYHHQSRLIASHRIVAAIIIGHHGHGHHHCQRLSNNFILLQQHKHLFVHCHTCLVSSPFTIRFHPHTNHGVCLFVM
jgi:hypothetical protein